MRRLAALVLILMTPFACGAAEDALSIQPDGQVTIPGTLAVGNGQTIEKVSNDSTLTSDNPSATLPTQEAVSGYVNAQIASSQLRAIYYAGKPASDRSVSPSGHRRIKYDSQIKASEANLIDDGYFVCPPDGAGLYSISASARMNDLKEDRFIQMEIHVLPADGSPNIRFASTRTYAYRGSTRDPAPNVSAVVPMHPGDKAYVTVYHNDDSSNTITTYSYVTIARVAPHWESPSP